MDGDENKEAAAVVVVMLMAGGLAYRSGGLEAGSG